MWSYFPFLKHKLFGSFVFQQDDNWDSSSLNESSIKHQNYTL